MSWKVHINCYRSFVVLYEIILYSFCKVFKYIGQEGKLCPPLFHTYLFNIHYCSSLTEAESVTKDCPSRPNRLQSAQASLRKRLSIQQHIPPLPQMVCKWFLWIFRCIWQKYILIEAAFFFLFLLVLNHFFFTWYKSNVNIFRNSFCTDLKYIFLDGILFHPICDSYPLSIHYYYPLTQAESVTKDSSSRRNHHFRLCISWNIWPQQDLKFFVSGWNVLE